MPKPRALLRPVSEAMPFDIPYGTPIGLGEAQKAILGAVTEAKEHNWKMSISVADPNGCLVTVSQAKARTAAMFRRPSGVFQTAVNTGGTPAILSVLTLNGAVASEGGFLIVLMASWLARSAPAAASSPRTRSSPKPAWRQSAASNAEPACPRQPRGLRKR